MNCEVTKTYNKLFTDKEAEYQIEDMLYQDFKYEKNAEVSLDVVRTKLQSRMQVLQSCIFVDVYVLRPVAIAMLIFL